MATVPPPLARRELDRSAVRLGDLAHDREAQPRARQAARRLRRGRSGRTRAAGRRRAMPGPWSRTDDRRRRRPPPRPRRRPGSTWRRCRAGSPTARSSRAGDAAHERRLAGRGERRRSARCRRRARPPRPTSRSSRTSSALGARAGRRARARQVADQRGHLLELARRRRRAARSRSSGGSVRRARQHLDVRAQARQRRAQLMRSVGDELALRAARIVERCRASC